LKCGCCGANFSMCSTSSYGCATNLNRGHAACANKLRVPRRFVEGRLIEAIRGDLLSKEAVDAFIKEIAILFRQAELDTQPQHKAMERQLVEAEKSIANIMTAIKAGIITASTKAELEKAEATRIEAETALKAGASTTKELPTLLPRATERYKALVKDLGNTLQRDVAQARHHLKTLLGSINLMPQPEGHLVAELRHDRESIARLTYGNDWKILLVAGAGFEPAAFRL